MMMKPDVKKMFTGLAQLSVCPSQYFGNMNADAQSACSS